jgi:hypothetical protein
MIIIIAFLLLLTTISGIAQDVARYKVVGSRSASLAVGDFDKDGDEDLIGINYGFGNPSLELVENKSGDPQNLSAIKLKDGFLPSGNLNSLDYDKDGDLDLIVGQKSGNMNVLINSGSFTFENIDLKVPSLDYVKLIDIDQDSDIDMIGYFNNSNLLYFYTNNGANNFASTNIQPFTKSIATMDAADLNSDGKVEIIIGISQFFDEHILLLKNTSPGKYDTARIAYNDFKIVNQVSLIDIDRDGKKDILACNESVGIGAWINRGNLNFEYKKLVSYTQSSSLGYLKFIATDLNGDGHLDLVTGNNSDGILLHINTNKTTLTYDTKTGTSISPSFDIVSTNLDKDKDNDFFVSNGELWFCENKIAQLTSISDINMRSFSGIVNQKNSLKILDTEFQESLINIVTTSGQILNVQSIQDGNIDIRTLQNGYYFLKCYSKSGKEQSYTFVKY